MSGLVHRAKWFIFHCFELLFWQQQELLFHEWIQLKWEKIGLFSDIHKQPEWGHSHNFQIYLLSRIINTTLFQFAFSLISVYLWCLSLPLIAAEVVNQVEYVAVKYFLFQWYASFIVTLCCYRRSVLLTRINQNVNKYN